ncbi:hypothetical protein ALC56_14424, partial [Trachymyrmex septentrionalis]
IGRPRKNCYLNHKIPCGYTLACASVPHEEDNAVDVRLSTVLHLSIPNASVALSWTLSHQEALNRTGRARTCVPHMQPRGNY